MLKDVTHARLALTRSGPFVPACRSCCHVVRRPLRDHEGLQVHEQAGGLRGKDWKPGALQVRRASGRQVERARSPSPSCLGPPCLCSPAPASLSWHSACAARLAQWQQYQSCLSCDKPLQLYMWLDLYMQTVCYVTDCMPAGSQHPCMLLSQVCVQVSLSRWLAMFHVLQVARCELVLLVSCSSCDGLHLFCTCLFYLCPNIFDCLQRACKGLRTYISELPCRQYILLSAFAGLCNKSTSTLMQRLVSPLADCEPCVGHAHHAL